MLEVGGYRLEVLRTPGHTPSHLCLWMAEQQVMFTGDHVLFDITPNITRWPNLENALGCYLRSLKQVREYDVKRPCPPTGPPEISMPVWTRCCGTMHTGWRSASRWSGRSRGCSPSKSRDG